MNGKELLNFANKLEDDHKDKGYKWLYDKLRYEIIKKHQEAINLIPCCKSVKGEQVPTFDEFITNFGLQADRDNEYFFDNEYFDAMGLYYKYAEHYEINP